MKLNRLDPMLWVDDVKATINWYVTTLGFEERNYVPGLEWGVVEKNAVTIMLTRPNQHEAFNGPQFSGSLYIHMDNVAELWEKLKDGPHIYYGLEDFEYGMREFAIKDCNGYILQFGQDISND